MQNISIFKWETKENTYLIKHDLIKRLFDISFSLLVLILGSPFFFIIGLIVCFTSSGPIFFGHERVGRGNKKIKCWKFRTMVKDADKCLDQLLENPKMKAEWSKFYKLKNDPRITSIGKFLRKTSLDELPQFYNVLKGNLSIVGPRPCVESELKENYGAKTQKILSIRPGITGIWQVSGRNDLTRNQRIRIEELYIDNHNLIMDMKIILRTIPHMIFSKGAY